MAVTFNVETVPVYLAMLVIVPLTFDAIKVVLEDKLDFDVIINRNMLRVFEAALAVMIFPTAAIVSICLAAYTVGRKSFKLAQRIMEHLSEPEIFSTIGFYICLIALFLSILIVIILLLELIYKAL